MTTMQYGIGEHVEARLFEVNRHESLALCQLCAQRVDITDISREMSVELLHNPQPDRLISASPAGWRI